MLAVGGGRPRFWRSSGAHSASVPRAPEGEPRWLAGRDGGGWVVTRQARRRLAVTRWGRLAVNSFTSFFLFDAEVIVLQDKPMNLNCI